LSLTRQTTGKQLVTAPEVAVARGTSDARPTIDQTP
jgi:hypothetical protein